MNILLTGATGYIGRRLLEKLLTDESVRLRLFVRNSRKVQADLEDRVELFEGNTLEKESIQKGLEGIDVAYYLIHSMGAGADSLFDCEDRSGRFPALLALPAASWLAIHYFELSLTSLSITF
jgi:uncharacterized protein YbjT (DUF2867 family)